MVVRAIQLQLPCHLMVWWRNEDKRGQGKALSVETKPELLPFEDARAAMDTFRGSKSEKGAW